ncbi:MAG: hypothetical protein WC730_01930 [Patescibacteria group bacterium]|jgi:hypothetical protein
MNVFERFPQPEKPANQENNQKQISLENFFSEDRKNELIRFVSHVILEETHATGHDSIKKRLHRDIAQTAWEYGPEVIQAYQKSIPNLEKGVQKELAEERIKQSISNLQDHLEWAHLTNNEKDNLRARILRSNQFFASNEDVQNQFLEELIQQAYRRNTDIQIAAK